MHKRKTCGCCGTWIDLCQCTPAIIQKHAEDSMKEFEFQQSKGSMTDKQMASYLISQGYSVKKPKVNKKKLKKRR